MFQNNKIDWIAIKRLFNNQGWQEIKKYLKRLDISFKNSIINIDGIGEEFVKKYYELKGKISILDMLLRLEMIVEENIERERYEEENKIKEE